MSKRLCILVSNIKDAVLNVFVAAPGVLALSSSFVDGVAASVRLYYGFGLNEANTVLNG